MKVHVTMEVEISDAFHPDHAARLIDAGLASIARAQTAGDGLQNWQTLKIEQVKS